MKISKLSPPLAGSRQNAGQFKIKKYLLALALFFAAVPVLAADMFFAPEAKNLRPGEIYEAKILVSSKETVNAFEGRVLFSGDNLKVEEIRDGNSLITLWIERPQEKGKGVISFSGVTPGGYVGDNGNIFSVIFRALDNGDGKVEIKDAKALKNDGNGSPAKIYLRPLIYKISGDTVDQESKLAKKPTMADDNPPEEFKPEIVFIDEMDGGKWFAVFTAQDKGSGIGHYEVKESRKYFPFFSKWIVAESPHVLQDQKLKSFIYVRALDKSGNLRTVVAQPLKFKWYDNYFLWIIIIFISGVVLFWFVFKRKK